MSTRRTGMWNTYFTVAGLVIINSCFVVSIFAQRPHTRNSTPSYYLRSTNNPSYGHLWTLNYDDPQGCHEGHGLADGEAQGVAHDDDNWYFTWTCTNTGYLFKVPVDVPINDDVMKNPRVHIVNMNQFPDLAGYWHWGDPDHYNYSGTDYIVVPMTGGCIPIIGIFRANDLSLVAYGNLTMQRSTGWCAIHPKTGDLYTSEDFDYAPPVPDCDDQSAHFRYPRTLLRYRIPWESLPRSGYKGAIELKYVFSPTIELLTRDGQQHELYNMQGGEFTPGGDLLYICAGSGCCEGHGHGQEFQYDGLHVFDALSWKEVIRSFNHSPRFPFAGPVYFDYFYPLGCGGGNCLVGGEAASWSPEGLTIWDLNDGRAPGITGQLHVLLYKYRVAGANREVFEHFGQQINVDKTLGIDKLLLPCVDQLPAPDDDPLPGDISKPFKTVKFAVNSYPAWYGAQIAIKDSAETVPSIMVMQDIVAYEVGAAPSSIEQGRPFPDMNVRLYNFSSPPVSGSVAIDFFLSPDPVRPDSPATDNDIDLGTVSVNVSLAQKEFQSVVVSGLTAPCNLLGKYYLGASLNGGPASSPSNIVKIVVTPDTTPPVIVTKKQGPILWPPNHRYHTISVSDCIESVTDLCDSAPTISVISVASDEGEDLRGDGDGDRMSDIIITCPDTVRLRAERDGNGNGRIYSITYAATDNSGNRSTAVCHVYVPHDNSGKPATEGPGSGHVVKGNCAEITHVTHRTPSRSTDVVQIPAEYAAEENFPNPFNPSTSIQFSLPRPEFVSLKVFDVVGREVTTLVSQYLSAGAHSAIWNADNSASGVYYYRLQAGAFTVTRKLMLIK